jgi:hypothetical protein
MRSMLLILGLLASAAAAAAPTGKAKICLPPGNGDRTSIGGAGTVVLPPGVPFVSAGGASGQPDADVQMAITPTAELELVRTKCALAEFQVTDFMGSGTDVTPPRGREFTDMNSGATATVVADFK